MAETVIYVSKSCTVTLTMPSDKHTVEIIRLDGKHPPAHNPSMARAAVRIKYHGQL